jgi:hypothetical protein
MRLAKIRRWIEEEKYYLWVVISVVFLNATFSIVSSLMAPFAKQETLPQPVKILNEAELAAALRDNVWFQLFFGVGTLAAFALFFVGLFFIIQFSRQKAKGEPIVPWRLPDTGVLWGLRDVFHVVVLLILAGYLIEFIQLVFFYPAGWKISESLRLLISTLMIDCFVLYLIVRLVTVEKKQALSDLGLSTRAFFRNLLFGVKGGSSSKMCCVPLP